MPIENEFDENDSIDIIKLLHFPRLAGTEGGEKAVSIIEQKFKALGTNVVKEDVKACYGWIGSVTQIGCALAGILTLIMILLSKYAPEWNILVFVFLLGLAIWGLNKLSGGTRPIIGNEIHTENLLMKIPQKSKKITKKVIFFSGHHDTKSQRLTTIQRAVAFTVGVLTLLLFLLLILLQFILILFNTFVPNWYQLILYVLFIIIELCCIPLSFNTLGDESPGALDNSSSVAAIYMLLKYFQKNPLENFELWFLITGAEEVGMFGAINFVEKHEQEIDPKLNPDSLTYVINFDMIGRKDCEIEYMESSGLLKKKPVCPPLNGLVKKISDKLGYTSVGKYLPTGASTDRFIFSKRGIVAMDFNNQKAAFEAHSPKDTIEHFDPELHKKFVIVSALMAEELDKK